MAISAGHDYALNVRFQLAFDICGTHDQKVSLEVNVMAAVDPKVSRSNKPKKRRWDAILVGVGMSVAFVIVLMKITGYFPCDIVNSLQMSAKIDCGDSVESNFGAFFNWVKDSIRLYFP